MLPGPWELLEEKVDWRGACLYRGRRVTDGTVYLLEDLALAAQAKERIYREIVDGLAERIALSATVQHPALRRPVNLTRHEDRYFLVRPMDDRLWECWGREPHPADPAEAGRWITVMAGVQAAYHQAGLTTKGLARTDLVPTGEDPLILEPISQSYLAPYRDRERFDRCELAPEASRGQGWDQASDLFALGVNAYLLSAGRPPLAGHGPDLLHNLLSAAIIDPRAHAPSLSPDFAGAILSLLERNPGRRPSAEALTLRLAALAGAGGLTATTAEQEDFAHHGRKRADLLARRERARGFLRKNSGIVAAVLGGLAVIAVFILFRGQPAPPAITSEMGPAQVVGAYYRAITDLNETAVGEALAPGVGKDVRTMVTNLFVIHRATIAQGGLSLDAPGPLRIEDLTITRTGATRVEYIARYDLVLRKGSESGPLDEIRTCRDQLVLARRKDRRVGEKWVIIRLTQRTIARKTVPAPPEEKSRNPLMMPPGTE